MEILTEKETQAISMRARLKVLQGLDKKIAKEIRGWYEWEQMTPAMIRKTADYIQRGL